MQQKLKRNIVIALVAVFLLGLGYWFVSTNFIPAGIVLQQPANLDNLDPVNLPKTGIKATPDTIPDSQAPEKSNPVRKGFVILLKPDAQIDPNGALAKYLNMPEVSHHKLQHLNTITFIVPEAWALEPIHKEIAQDPAVVDISKNALTRMYQVTPNDPLFAHPDQWGLNNINAPQAWHYTTGDETVVIAVLDTGVDYTHPDLADNIWVNEAELNGLPLVDDDDPSGPRPCHPREPLIDLFCDDLRGASTNFFHANNDPQDVGSQVAHGTAVASIIAAFGNNKAFSTGVAWRAKIFPVVVYNSFGVGTVIGIFQVFNYVIEMKLRRGVNIRVINLSGSLSESPEIHRRLYQALEDANILFVQAAGNDRSTVSDTVLFPPSPIFIHVASIDRSGVLSDFSNFGLAVHLAAPGGAIPSLTSRLAYAMSNHPVILQINFINFDPSDKLFSQWSAQPPESWLFALVRNIRSTANDVPLPSSGGFPLAAGAWYQSTQVATTLTFPDQVDLGGYRAEDLFFQISLSKNLLGDTSLKLDIGADTPSLTTWYPVMSWFGIATEYIEYRFQPPSMLGQGTFQNHFRLRFRTTPSMDNRNLVVLNWLSVRANPPIPPFSDIPQDRISSYFPPLDGTSFSAPYVTGVAALVWAHRPELSAAQVQSVITNPENLDPFPCAKSNIPCVTSQGTLNAFKILTAITTAEVSILGHDEIVTQPNQAYTFPVRLHRAPGVFNTTTERVVFETEISYRLNDEMVVHNTSLTFTLDNWYQPQSITLTNQAGALGDGLFTIPDSDQRIITTIRLQASESPDSDPDFAMTTAEKYICLQKYTGQPLILGLCRLTGLEGEPIAYHLTLSQRPDSTLTLSIAVMPHTVGNVSPAQLIFTPDNWNTPQTLIVHPSQVDLLRNIPQRFTLQATLSDTSSDLISSITQTITLLDNQTSPTLVFKPQTPFLLTGFSTQTLTLRLGGQAASGVQVSLASEPQDLLELSPNTLRFTPQNWNQAQTISLRTQRVGTFPTTITAQVDANLSDPQYHGVTAVLPGLVRTQNLRILGLNDQTLVEGTSYDYALMLSATPNQTIRINPVVEPSDSVVFIPQTLTFTPNNWNTTQTLSVRASVDFHNATNRIARIILNGMPSHFMLPTTSHLTIIDSDESIPDFVVQPEQIRLVDAHSQTLSIHLSGNPSDRLELALASSHPQRVRVSPSTITFTPQNWFEPQTFFVSATDFITDLTTVIVRPDPGSRDTIFRDTVKQIPVLADRRAIRLIGFGSRKILEGTTYTYHLSLSTTPYSTVFLTVTSDFPQIVSFSTTSLTFTESDWNIPKPLAVRALAQIALDRNLAALAILEDTSNQIASLTFSILTLVDDGRRPGPVGLILEPPGPFFVAQDHHDTVNVKLAGQPIVDVYFQLEISGPHEDDYQTQPGFLHFDIDRWHIPQSIDLTSMRRSNPLFVELVFSLQPYAPTGNIEARYLRLQPREFIYPPLEILGFTNKTSSGEQTVVYELRPGLPDPTHIPTFPDQAYLSSPVTVTASSVPPDAVDFEPGQLFFAHGGQSPAQRLTVTPRSGVLQKQQPILLRLSSSERFVRSMTAMITQTSRKLATPMLRTTVDKTTLSADWPEVANAESYQINLYSGTDRAVEPVASGHEVEIKEGVVSTVHTSLFPETLYTLEVIAVAAQGSSYADSEAALWVGRTGKLTLPTPTAAEIQTSATTNTITVEAIGVPAVYSRFYPDTNLNYHISLGNDVTQTVTLDYPLKRVRHTYTTLKPDTNYAMAVVASSPSQDIFNDSAPWWFSIRTDPLPRLATPENLVVQADQTTLTFSWRTVPDARSYTITIYRGSNTQGNRVRGPLTVTTLRYTATGLELGTTYTVVVVAQADGYRDSQPRARTFKAPQNSHLRLRVFLEGLLQ